MCAFRALFALDSCFRRNGEEKMRTAIRFNQSAPNIDNAWNALGDFMRYCNIVNPPVIQSVLI